MARSKYIKSYKSKQRVKTGAILAVVALLALSFGGSPAHAEGAAALAPSRVPQMFAHTTVLVASIPSKDGIYKFCDGPNLVYETVIDVAYYGGGGNSNSMQVQFNSAQCQLVAPVAKLVKSATAKKPKK